jgi:hypothetical protein
MFWKALQNDHPERMHNKEKVNLGQNCFYANNFVYLEHKMKNKLEKYNWEIRKLQIKMNN